MRVFVASVGILVAILAVGALRDLLAIKGDLDEGRDRLEHLDLETLRARGLEGSLADAAAALDDAADRARSSPFLAALGVLPVVDDQVAALEDLTAAADHLGEHARLTGTRVADAIADAGAQPRARVALLDTVASELDRVEEVAAGIDLGARGRLLPPLQAARRDVADALDSVPDRLRPLRRQVAALRDLLAGPSSYLVVVGNNAEMRAGAGMPLSAGPADIRAGDIELGDFESTVTEMYAEHPTGRFNAAVPEVFRRMYPRWNLGRDFAETSVIPYFPVTAPIYADIAADTQGWAVDGVLFIDAMALAELLSVVGPVDIEGTTYSAATAPQLVLNQPYLDYDSLDERDERLEAQSELANALFDAIQQRDIDLLDVVAALQRSATGRHLMAWSRDPVLQDLFRSFGAAGDISPGETLVSFQNTGANKLDWYIEPSIELDVEPLTTDEWQVTLQATIPNPAGIVTSGYLDGTLPGLEGGTHRVLVTVQPPALATDVAILTHEATEYGDDGVSKVVGTRFTIPRGEERVVEFRFRLPAGVPGLAVVPSARVEPVPWTFEGTTFDDDVRVFVPFGPFPEPVSTSSLVASWMAVLVALAGVGFAGSSARVAGPGQRATRLWLIDIATAAALFTAAGLLAVAGVVLA